MIPRNPELALKKVAALYEDAFTKGPDAILALHDKLIQDLPVPEPWWTYDLLKALLDYKNAREGVQLSPARFRSLDPLHPELTQMKLAYARERLGSLENRNALTNLIGALFEVRINEADLDESMLDCLSKLTLKFVRAGQDRDLRIEHTAALEGIIAHYAKFPRQLRSEKIKVAVKKLNRIAEKWREDEAADLAAA